MRSQKVYCKDTNHAALSPAQSIRANSSVTTTCAYQLELILVKQFTIYRFRNLNGDILYYNGDNWGITSASYKAVTGCKTGFIDQATDNSNQDVYNSVWPHYYG